MVQRVGGNRRKTRHKLSKATRQKGKINITGFIAKFDEGEKVCLKAEPSYAKGQYFPRYHGMTGLVGAKRGNCYEVTIKDRDQKKILIVHPVHLKRLA